MSNRSKLILSAVAPAALTPGMAFAASGCGTLQGICDLVDSAKTLAGTTVPGLLFALALAYFLYGVFSYVSTGADEKKRTEARGTVIYGIIILFVMSSVWGLVRFVQTATGINGSNNAPSFPTV